ncbi:MAG: HipA N-terminal domain-containing protein, partial [Rectinemataceae bacterium]|nr:HipA N-terminal domain-containing protein [Rectinemataceae bacterium]
MNVIEPHKFQSLTVWHLENPAMPRKVGTVSLAPGMQRLSFRYAAEWIDEGFDLSPDMQRFNREKPNTSDILAPHDKIAPGALDDAMPDRWGQTIIRVVDNPPRLTPLDFLFLAGDRRFGCLGMSIEPNAYVPYPLPALPKKESLAAAAELIEKILSKQPVD